MSNHDIYVYVLCLPIPNDEPTAHFWGDFKHHAVASHLTFTFSKSLPWKVWTWWFLTVFRGGSSIVIVANNELHVFCMQPEGFSSCSWNHIMGPHPEWGWIQSTLSHSVSLRLMIISYQLHEVLSSGIIPPRFSNRKFAYISYFPMHHSCPAYLILFS